MDHDFLACPLRTRGIIDPILFNRRVQLSKLELVPEGGFLAVRIEQGRTRAPCSTHGRQIAFAIIRRSRTSLLAHDDGVLALERYLLSLKNGSRNIGEYFEALSRFENAVATLYQGLDVYAKVTKQRLFEKLDGSPESRLNLLYNISKHYLPEQLPDGHLQALWIANDGLHCSAAALTWEEFANLLENLAEIAQYISEGHYASQLSETTNMPETLGHPPGSGTTY